MSSYGEKDGKQEPLTVSQAVGLARDVLERLRLTVVGEVSEVSESRNYKAVYFTVKDSGATLSCMMWRDAYKRAGVKLELGAEVELSGKFSVYGARGAMQFQVARISLAGEGQLRMQMAQLAERLRAEGLMDPSRKLPIPRMPETIGVVTSPSGDAVRDVLRTLRERFPLATVKFAGVQVEGAGAVERILEGMRSVYRAKPDVILLVRGGGAYEALMPFNDERIARAIVACPIPVITGIGHEPDTTLADLVADKRTATPTFAAAAASEIDVAMLDKHFAGASAALNTAMQHRLDRENATMRLYAERPLFRDPHRLFAGEAQSLDYALDHLSRAIPLKLERQERALSELEGRFQRALPLFLERERRSFDEASGRLVRSLPTALDRFDVKTEALAGRLRTDLGRFGVSERVAIDVRRKRLTQCGSAFGETERAAVALSAARLHDLSPLTTLARGYAIARDDSGALVSSVEGVSVGSRVNVSVSDGVLSCCVEDVSRVETSVEEWKE